MSSLLVRSLQFAIDTIQSTEKNTQNQDYLQFIVKIARLALVVIGHSAIILTTAFLPFHRAFISLAGAAIGCATAEGFVILSNYLAVLKDKNLRSPFEEKKKAAKDISHQHSLMFKALFEKTLLTKHIINWLKISLNTQPEGIS